MPWRVDAAASRVSALFHRELPIWITKLRPAKTHVFLGSLNRRTPRWLEFRVRNHDSGPDAAFGRSQKNASKPRRSRSTTRRAGKMAEAWVRTATEAWLRTATMEQVTKFMRSGRWIDSCCAALHRGAAPRTTVLDSDIEAVASFQQAADEGFPVAQYMLARLLSCSESWKNYRLPNIAENDSLAAEYFRKAAEQDFGSAQYPLAEMYFHGHGLERNMLMAEQWSDKAIEALADVTE